MTMESSFIRRISCPGTTPCLVKAAVLSLAVLIFPFSTGLAQVDITERVRRNTPLNQTIQDFCANHCQGNQSEGHLASVVVQPIGGGRYRGSTIADLRNRQEIDDPFHVTVFDWTVRIRAEGLLNADTCMVVIDSITVENDLYGVISGMLEQVKGHAYPIPNCKRLLP
jgi:hypothetical protein